MKNQNYGFKLGTFECIVVSDGTFAYPHPAQIFFANAPKEVLEQTLHLYSIIAEEWEQYVSPYTSLFIDTGQYRVLVDTGAGGFAPTTGKLIPNLQTERILPEGIDMVILTHGHPDHIGGNVGRGGKPAFPNARYVMLKEEWDFWTKEPDLSTLTIDEHLKQVLLESARNSLPPIQGQLDLVEHEAEIVPGIHAIATPGHTPGHMAVGVCSGSEELFCISDAALHPIHLTQPGWYAAVDLEPEQALASRRRLMERVATGKAIVYASHFSFPSLGRVRKKGDAWVWQPIEADG